MEKKQDKFINSLLEIGKKENFQIKKYINRGRSTNNIVELSGKINCLVYFHICTKEPLRWGVTKSRIEELKNSVKEWFLVFLYDPPAYRGFILAENDTHLHINEGLWPMGKDNKNKNEYKIRPGVLKYKTSIDTLGDLMKLLRDRTKNLRLI